MRESATPDLYLEYKREKEIVKIVALPSGLDPALMKCSLVEP
jgi:hypothetical protein